MNDLINQIKWNEQGLVPVIAQDINTLDVLMMAWMNAEALSLTQKTSRAVYFSRSRQRLWRKGESSGHEQIVHEMRLDCDGDALIIKVQQVGGIACHTGRAHCFYRRYESDEWTTVEPVLQDPSLIYSS